MIAQERGGGMGNDRGFRGVGEIDNRSVRRMTILDLAAMVIGFLILAIDALSISQGWVISSAGKRFAALVAIGGAALVVVGMITLASLRLGVTALRRLARSRG